ncbi:alanine racemase [Spirosomataceae bacterium TFI 002]|nr:alanine racemase [Spirosomataceae bacterium TFI 002]
MPFFDYLPLADNKVLLTDSRYVTQASNSIFFAIKGVRHDGHVYIQDLIDKGVSEFIVEQHWATDHADSEIINAADFYVVNNATKALQLLASKQRSKFNFPIIGITGSNGKTIIKEWLNTLLEDDFSVAKSPRSYNSQIGVPLSVWQLNSKHEIGIFEAGISQPAEMQNLQDIIRPTIGIFSNIGSAHDEGFRSRKQKITEKLRLFRHSKFLIYRQDYKNLDQEIKIFLKAVNPQVELFAWSSEGVGVNNVEVQKENNFSNLKLYWQGEELNFQIPFTDDASIENAIHAIFAVFIVLKDTDHEPKSLIERRLPFLKPIAMRLELKEGINDCYLIDDTYNNDLGGLEMALNFMDQHHTTRGKLLILSDVLQTGLNGKELYKRIADLLHKHGIQELIGIGKVISKHKNLFEEGRFYESTEDFLKQSAHAALKSKLILIKGARHFSFEKIVNALQQKVHGTVFEINLDAITNNLNFYRSKIGGDTKIMVMVKASAYGSGSGELASLLQYHRVDYLGVAYTDEGVELRQNGIMLPIMVLNPQPETFQNLITHKIEPEIYSLRLLKAFIDFISKQQLTEPVKIHLKIDTGMHRLGFEKGDLKEALELINECPELKIASVFSHLVGADSSEHTEFSKNQISYLEDSKKLVLKSLSYVPLFHIANTAGILRFPEAKMDMVRLGIGIYGVESNGEEQKSLQLVGRLKTTISQIKQVKKEESVGYSRKGILTRDSKIATIGIGYADGYDRKLSNGKGKVLINKTLCPTVGNVCMDMTMIDVTEIDCKEGDEVIVFGENPSIFDLSEALDTIPYEILTSISERVKRVFYKE